MSDLHLTADSEVETNQNILNLSNRIRTITSDCNSIIIAISGDITDSGAPDQFSKADDFLSLFIDRIKHERSDTSVQCLYSPGNHDNYLVGLQSTRNAVIDKVQVNKTYDQDEVNTCCSVQSNFFSFSDKYEFLDVDYHDKLVYSGSYLLDDVYLYFVCVNTSWLSKKNEPPSSVLLPIETMTENITIPDRRIVIAIMHHPMNWLDVKDKKISNTRTFIHKNCNIVLTGHEHIYGAVNAYNYSTDTNTLFLSAPKGDGPDSGCNALVIDTISNTINLVSLSLCDNVFRETTNVTFPLIVHSIFDFSAEYRNLLNDLEIQIDHPGKDDLLLSDIYVEPDLKVLNSTNLNPEYASFDTVRSSIKAKKVFWIGSDQSGKTTVVKELIRYYHQSSFLPVLIHGKDIKNANVDKLIRVALKSQYQELDWDSYMQLSPDQRILVIDDVDHASVGIETLSMIYDRLRNVFSCIHATIRDTELYSASSQKNDFYWSDSELYEILPFGHVKRDELIKKWVMLSHEEHLDNEILIKEVDLLCKKIEDITLTKIPSYPFFLLMILQGLKSTTPSNYKFTAYGDCYLALIIFSIHKFIGQAKSESYLNYLSCLSYDFFVNKRVSITQDQFRSFFISYSNEYNVPDDHILTLQNLLKSKLLKQTHDGFIRFNHPYILHFCISRYLARSIQSKEVRSHVAEICQKIHLFRNANIVIFLTHFLEDEEFWDELQLNVICLFDKYKEETLCKENTDFLKELFAELRDLIVEQKKDILDNREKLQEQKDNLVRQVSNGSHDDDQPDMDDLDSRFEVFNEVQKQIRYLEIIGQILKNRSGSLKKDKIKEILSQSLLSSLRLIGFLIHNQKEMLDTAVTYIRDQIKEEVDRRNSTSKLNGEKKLITLDDAEIELKVKRVLLSISFSSINSLLHKTAISLGSEHLLTQLDEISKETPYPSIQLIHIMVNLEYTHSLNIDDLIRVKNAHKDNLYVYNVLRHLVHRHLYMHNVGYKELQKIAEAFDFTIQEQRLLQLKHQR